MKFSQCDTIIAYYYTMSSTLLAIKIGILVASLISYKYKAFALIEQQDIRHLFSYT